MRSARRREAGTWRAARQAAEQVRDGELGRRSARGREESAGREKSRGERRRRQSSGSSERTSDPPSECSSRTEQDREVEAQEGHESEGKAQQHEGEVKAQGGNKKMPNSVHELEWPEQHMTGGNHEYVWTTTCECGGLESDEARRAVTLGEEPGAV